MSKFRRTRFNSEIGHCRYASLKGLFLPNFHLKEQLWFKLVWILVWLTTGFKTGFYNLQKSFFCFKNNQLIFNLNFLLFTISTLSNLFLKCSSDQIWTKTLTILYSTEKNSKIDFLLFGIIQRTIYCWKNANYFSPFKNLKNACCHDYKFQGNFRGKIFFVQNNIFWPLLEKMYFKII